MPQKEQYDKDINVSKEQAFGLTLIVIEILANVTKPFLWIRGGVDQPGWFGLVTFIAIPIWAGESHSELVYLFWQVWIAAMLFYRLLTTREKHSWDIGEPWVGGIFTRDVALAATIQAILVIALGYAIEDKGLGRMLMASGGASLASELIVRYGNERRDIARRNALENMRNETDRYR